MTGQTFQDDGTAAINWIYRSYNRARPYIKPGLDKSTRHPEWTSRLLEAVGRPDEKMYNVAVTGSKGKGSHAILIAAMLQKMGFCVGLFTGPHLVDFMERFRINGEVIPESAFVKYVKEIGHVTDKWELPKDEYFGPVGLLAVVAAKWFFDQHTDINVFELGRGALHDDVNRISHAGAVLTPIFLEHTAQLGQTFHEVGTEKAGVITEQTKWVYSHPQTTTVQEIIRAQSNSVGASLSTLCDEVEVLRTELQGKTCIVTVRSPMGTSSVLLPDAQYHLAANVGVAFAAAAHAALDKRPELVLPDTLDLRDLSLPGRLQTVAVQPEVVVDGTIHGRSAEIVRDFIRSRRSTGNSQRIGAILGLPADKDGVGVLKALMDVLDFVVLCRAHNPHLTFDDRWGKLAHHLYPEAHVVEYLEDALVIAREKVVHASDILLVLGTQSLVGDAMRVFGIDTKSIWRHPSLIRNGL